MESTKKVVILCKTIRNSVIVLFPQILTRREASHLFEEAGEMMGIIEAQEA